MNFFMFIKIQIPNLIWIKYSDSSPPLGRGGPQVNEGIRKERTAEGQFIRISFKKDNIIEFLADRLLGYYEVSARIL